MAAFELHSILNRLDHGTSRPGTALSTWTKEDNMALTDAQGRRADQGRPKG